MIEGLAVFAAIALFASINVKVPAWVAALFVKRAVRI